MSVKILRANLLVSAAVKLAVPFIEGAVNGKIDDYGSVEVDRFDYENKSITFKLKMKGENEPIKVTATGLKYESNYLQPLEIYIDREWMNNLYHNYKENRKDPKKPIGIEVPEEYRAIVGKLF